MMSEAIMYTEAQPKILPFDSELGLMLLTSILQNRIHDSGAVR